MKKVVNYKVEGKEWVEAQNKAFEKLNKNAKIDGFRPGKAPRSVFEKKYGKSEINMEASDNLIQAKYRELLIGEGLMPVVEPKVDIVKIDEEGLEVNFTFVMRPEIKLGDYKGLKVKKTAVRVTKDEIDHQIGHLLEDYAELSTKEGQVTKGDIAVIDFEGFKDGVAFDGGKSENYQLEIGSNSFIPGFEDGIIGMSKGEEKDLELTFPEDYMAEDLKGQKVIFKVKVNEVKERTIPEMDEAFFEDLGIEGVDSKEKLESQVKAEIKERKEKEAETKFIDELLEKASNNMTAEIDDEIVMDEAHNMYHSFLEKMKLQGISEEMYLKFANTTEEKVLEQMKEEALKRVRNAYLLEEVIKAENISVTDEEADEKVAEIAKTYDMDKEDVLKELGASKEDLKYNLVMEKAINFLTENN